MTRIFVIELAEGGWDTVVGAVVGAFVGGGGGGRVGLGVRVAVGGEVGVDVGGTGVSVAVGTGVLVAVGGIGVGVSVGVGVGTGVVVSVCGGMVGVGAGADVPMHPAMNVKTTTSTRNRRCDMLTSFFVACRHVDTVGTWVLYFCEPPEKAGGDHWPRAPSPGCSTAY